MTPLSRLDTLGQIQRQSQYLNCERKRHTHCFELPATADAQPPGPQDLAELVKGNDEHVSYISDEVASKTAVL
jgi:hypothetical protein